MDPAGREEMLGLISRIHRDLGIAVMLSSHVLEDVERVCDHVVMLDRGRLVAAGPVGDLLEGTGEILVQVGEDAGPFAERLTAAGLTVSVEGTALLVEHRDDGVFDLIRDTAVDLGVALRGLRLRTRSLEDVYLGGTGVTEPREEVSSGRAG
jgi:ABC-2 type transport system ATP-binding protein